MDHTRTLLEDVALVFFVAAIATIVFQRLRQPTVLGYLVAGLIVGPHTPVPLFADFHRIEQLSELGVILVIFSIGIEFRFAKLKSVLPTAGLAAVVQVSAMLWIGYLIGQAAGWSTRDSLFLGGTICISSTMIVARVLARGSEDPNVGDNALGILIVQDLAAIVLIAVFTAIATGDSVPATQVARIVGELALFLVVSTVVGILVVPALIRESDHRGNAEVLLVAAVGVCFGLSLVAEMLGFSVALGAFIAGSVIAESGRRQKVEHLVEPVRDLFSALFFVSIGMLVDPWAVADSWLPIAVISIVVVVGQSVFATFGLVLAGRPIGVAVRTGMMLAQIGEFSFIIVGVGVAAGTVSPRLLAIAVGVAVVTTFLTPLLVRASGRVAAALERRLPHSLQTFIALYAAWLESLRRRDRRPGARRVRGAVARIVFDMVALTGIAVTVGAGRDWIAAQLEARTGLEHRWAVLVLSGAALVIAAPFVVSFARSVRRLGTDLAEQVLPSTDSGVDLAAAPRRALIVGLELTLSLVAIVPLVAVTAPFVPLYAGAAALAVTVGGLGMLFWRGATHLHGHARASADLILELLDRQRGEDESVPATPPLADLLPGLGQLVSVELAADSPAAGKTLAELNLRALTGAMVIALKRADGGGVAMPTGRDLLAAGDTLSISGTSAAIAAARRVLAGAE